MREEFLIDIIVRLEVEPEPALESKLGGVEDFKVVVKGCNVFGDLKLSGESVVGEDGELDVGGTTGWLLNLIESAEQDGLPIRRLPSYVLL